MREFNYPGYVFQRNGRIEAHIRDRGSGNKASVGDRKT